MSAPVTDRQGAEKQTVDKLAAAQLDVLRSRIEAVDGARPLLDRAATAREALAALEGGGFMLEAVRLLAHALPRREAVWWACMCARHTEPADLPAPDAAARDCAEMWVRRATDETRRAAFAHAQEANFQTPEAWAAVGAFWSGDSMSPLGQPPVVPAPNLTGQAVAGAVILSSVRDGDARVQAIRLPKFIAAARDIAAGGTGRLPPEKG